MPLQKTSVQVDHLTRSSLESLYPSLSFSDIIRLCMEYTLRNKPKLVSQKVRFEGLEEKEKLRNEKDKNRHCYCVLFWL